MIEIVGDGPYRIQIRAGTGWINAFSGAGEYAFPTKEDAEECLRTHWSQFTKKWKSSNLRVAKISQTPLTSAEQTASIP